MQTLPVMINDEEQLSNSSPIGDGPIKEEFQQESSADINTQTETVVSSCETEEDIVETLDETLKTMYFKDKDKIGELKALFKLGKHFYDLDEREKSIKFFKKGALLGHDTSQGYYGYMLMYGYGTMKDEKLAIEYLKKALETIPTFPHYHLGKYLLRNETYKEAVEHFRIGSCNNCYQCQIALGEILYKGEIVEKDREQAFVLCKKSYQAGEETAESMYRTMLYEKGDPPMDEGMKNYWFAKYGTKNIQTFELVKETNLMLVEDRVHLQIEQENEETLSKEVIVRFESKDFILKVKEVKSSSFLSCMLSPNWKDTIETEQERMVIDMRSIQNEIYVTSDSNAELVFENYVKLLRTRTCPKLTDTRIDVILMAKYLISEKEVHLIGQWSSCLVNFYILSLLGRADKFHIAMVTFFLHSDNCKYSLTKEMSEHLLSESELGPQEKLMISSTYVKLYQQFPTFPMKLSKFPL